MRLRALRWSIAFALVAGAATAGVALPHSSLRAVLRDVTRTAAAPVQADGATGHVGPDSAAGGHLRSGNEVGVLAPAPVLAAGLVLLAVAAHVRRRVVLAVPACRSCRAPPRRS